MALRSFFELTYEPPGRMSAGTACQLTLVFTPKLNQPIDAELQLLTATGPMSIPVLCSIPAAVVRFSTTSLDFGTIVRGESCSLTLTASNEGALSCPFTLERLHTTQPRGEGGEVDPAKLFEMSETGVLQPYSKQQLKVATLSH